MGALIDKLNATNAYKEQIRQAIERKKVAVPESTPLKDYPAKIDAIYPDAIFMRESNFGDGCKATLSNGDKVTQWANDVVYGNGIYVGYNLESTHTDYSSVGNAFLVKESTASDWVRVASSKPKKVVFFNGVFVCMYDSYSAGMRWSADGKTWNGVKVSGGTNYMGGLFFTDDNYLYLIKNDSSNDGSIVHLYESSDGKTFTKIDSSGFPTHSYPVTSIVYSDKLKKYYMCKSLYSGGAPRYVYYYSADLNSWTEFGDDLDGDFKLIGDRLYCNYFRHTSSIVELWSHYTDDGVTWKQISYTDDLGTETNTDINIFSRVNGVYFGFSYNSHTKYTIYYSENGIDGWKEYELPISLKFEPNWSVCNGIVFNMTIQSTNAEYVVFTRNYSFDGLTWFNEIHSMFVDVNDNNVTSKVINNFANKYSQDMLNTAYNAGVNSI